MGLALSHHPQLGHLEHHRGINLPLGPAEPFFGGGTSEIRTKGRKHYHQPDASRTMGAHCGRWNWSSRDCTFLVPGRWPTQGQAGTGWWPYKTLRPASIPGGFFQHLLTCLHENPHREPSQTNSTPIPRPALSQGPAIFGKTLNPTRKPTKPTKSYSLPESQRSHSLNKKCKDFSQVERIEGWARTLKWCFEGVESDREH